MDTRFAGFPVDTALIDFMARSVVLEAKLLPLDIHFGAIGG